MARNKINLLIIRNIQYFSFCGMKKLALSILIIVTTLMSPSCSSKQEISPSKRFSLTQDERVWLKEFFIYLLFEDPGAYVLYGHKPMSWSGLRPPRTEEEKAAWKVYYNSLPDEEKAKYFTKRDLSLLSVYFQKWKEIEHRFPISQYLFATFPPRFPNGPESLFFVNIEMLTRTLIENYDEIKRFVGYDFAPLQTVFDIENRDSKFWNKVLWNDAMLGILLGFGKENALFYEWHRQYEEENSKIGAFVKSLPSRTYEENDVLFPDPSNFILPIFGSYGLYPTDHLLIEHYRQDQKKIKKIYKGRDEVDVALEWLTR